MTPFTIRRAAAVGAVLAGSADLVVAAAESTAGQLGPLRFGATLDSVIGARYLLLVVGLVLVSAGRGLLRGKRSAWWIALVAAGLSIPAQHIKDVDAVGLVVTALFMGLLIVGRGALDARSDQDTVRRAWFGLALAELAVFVYGVLGLFFLDAQFRSSTTAWESLGDGVNLLLLLPTSTIEPSTPHGAWFLDSVRYAAMAVVLVGLARVMTAVVRTHGQTTATRDHVRRLLEAWGDTALVYFHLLDDKTWFFASDGEAFIGFRPVGRSAVALGGPVGRPGSRELVVREFISHCESNGWSPIFHQVTEEDRCLLTAEGLRSVKIGEEAVIEVQDWDVDAKAYKSLRSALRRMERVGCRVIELPAPITDSTMAELRAVSDAWMADGAHRERAFTLGRFDPAYLRGTPVLAVVDEAGQILAFANVIESYRSGIGNFDLMRRLPGSPNGVMELLFVALIERFRDAGYEGMSLGLAPLSGIEAESLADRSLQLVYDHGDRAFNFSGLHQFKEKWHPRWDPRFLVYRSASELPRAAAAVSRAGELPDPRRLTERLGAFAARYPFTLSLLGVVGWIMAATSASAMIHARLIEHFGLSFHDLLVGQLWRLATSQVVQVRPGWVLSNVALLVVAVPIAERRIRTRAAIAIFFLGDWASTIPSLIVLRIAAAAGDHPAASVLATRDSGSSSGAWALAGAVAWSLPPGRARTAAITVAIGFNAAGFALYHRLFHVQHLLSVLAALAMMQWWSQRSVGRRGDSAQDVPEAALSTPRGSRR